MEEASNKRHPSLPANYVTLVDLKQLWLQKQKQKQRDDENCANECKIKGNEQDLEHKAPVQSNPNPRTSNRMISHGGRRPIESRSWIQRNQSKQAPVVQAKQLQKDVVKLEPEKGDKTGAEIEGRIASLSLSGRKSVTVRNFPPFKKQNEGDYHRFEREFRMNKDRSRSENGLVWVKKGEAS